MAHAAITYEWWCFLLPCCNSLTPDTNWAAHQALTCRPIAGSITASLQLCRHQHRRLLSNFRWRKLQWLMIGSHATAQSRNQVPSLICTAEATRTPLPPWSICTIRLSDTALLDLPGPVSMPHCECALRHAVWTPRLSSPPCPCTPHIASGTVCRGWRDSIDRAP